MVEKLFKICFFGDASWGSYVTSIAHLQTKPYILLTGLTCLPNLVSIGYKLRHLACIHTYIQKIFPIGAWRNMTPMALELFIKKSKFLKI